MHTTFSLLTATVFANTVCGFAIKFPASLYTRDKFELHEQVETLPAGWTYAGEASSEQQLNLRIALAHSHKDYITIAEEISDPASARYGQHLSAEELQAVLPNTDAASGTVTTWLKSHALDDYTVGQDWVQFNATVRQANSLLKADFAEYTYLKGDPVLRTESYSLPAGLSEHIDFIYPTVHFLAPKGSSPDTGLRRRQHIPTGPVTCSGNTCPSLLEKKYNITYRPADANSGSKIGIVGFLDRYPNMTDWKTFLTKYAVAKDTQAPSFTPLITNNGVNTYKGSDLNVEANLDLDYSVVFTGKIPVTYYSVGGRGTQLTQPGNKTLPTSSSQNEPYLEFMQYVLAQKNPPQVISISYSDDEQSVPPTYARRVCDLFAQAAARGISVIGASGDGGATGTGGNTACQGPDGKRRFVPTFPSSCPWITSVGATAAWGGAADFSSGGISNYFARPSWQANQVAGYLKAQNGSHKGLYNTTGRGIPDLSLLGDNYLTLDNGYTATHDGTSASTPVFAAMIALLNDIRLREKKPVLGFLNPLIYAANASSVFHDIADGSKNGGCADGNWFETGWAALKGWDAATGLGEPDFLKLKALFT